MVACYAISRSVGRISRTQPNAATHRRHQHTGDECLSDTRRAPQNIGNPARWAGQNVPPAQMVRPETQRLSADHIVQSVQNSETRSLWLCGSRSVTSSIAGNLKTRSLHQELFELR